MHPSDPDSDSRSDAEPAGPDLSRLSNNLELTGGDHSTPHDVLDVLSSSEALADISATLKPEEDVAMSQASSDGILRLKPEETRLVFNEEVVKMGRNMNPI